MANLAYNLAIETSSRQGSIALGRGSEMLCAVDLPTPRRHRVDLMPSVAKLCTDHEISPGDLREIYVSIGPGSFTGLRIAVTTAKVVSMITGAKIVAVPTIDVVAQNVPASDATLAVALNEKHQTVFGGLYQHDGNRWVSTREPDVQTLEQLLTATSGLTQLLGEKLPPVPSCDGLSVLDVELAKPQVKHVWQIGQLLASDQQFVDAYALVPLYAREPEAVKLWEQNKNKRVTCS
ncbi:MAG TPA: tRNA (adenosine(37)-N6)-threonylcarbamoyltransferase complex dimerization subunit type 1 TsaB [Phycisphaerales bacterium]|nr:tRNA (adenosine(37)-N6)-threonylcarbamoyltransferase complex dimerization subunit type 1 TsaB [Phycisphaerales bacterium]|tara:strand:- start:1473 stop:2177 length:705 start_codon:yes stop_codon:yes gene_type:complete